MSFKYSVCLVLSVLNSAAQHYAPRAFPGTVTAVVAQERTRRHLGTRVNVFINDRFSFALDLILAERRGLRPD
jgi:hypothetical protein